MNADDFGMSPGVTAGIIEAHTHGIVTSTSMLVNTPFSPAAAAAAREHPGLSIGLHACLTYENGTPTLNFDDTERCRAELRLQLERFTELNERPPTHLDSHHHVHRDPRLRHLFAELAEEHSLVLREHSSIRYLSSFYGQWGGSTHPEQIGAQNLCTLIDELGDGITELSCHPGHMDAQLESSYSEEREIELATLCAPEVRQRLAQNQVELIGFGSARRSLRR
jgi:predicted glycoside hydrolase/deacetylase ChbG (UPF0249 family)